MLLKKDILDFLASNNIKNTDTLLIHTSMRSLGQVEGGCDGIIDAFKEYLSKGLFLVPTHTWLTVGNTVSVYDVKTEKPCIGALPTVAMQRKDGIRSLHPTHSVKAFGDRAEEFVRGEQNCKTPCPKGGVWNRLYDENAVILLVGVGLNRNTYIHAIDEMLNLPDRLVEPVDITIVDYDGNKYDVNFRKHGQTGYAFFENYRKPLEYVGALKNAKLGDATVGIFYVRKATDLIKSLWEKADYNLCGEQKEIPEDYYK